MPEGLDIQWTSERSLCIGGASPVAIADALRGTVGIRDAVATEMAAFVTVDPLGSATPDSIARRLVDIKKKPAAEQRVHGIPACYDSPFAPDLAEVASLAGMSEAQVIDLHTSTDFTVAFMGFAPGFGYLTGLPEVLQLPRLPSPRRRLEAGSVGIAGPYSGVYALPGPGGWRIIARTSAVMFGVEREEPSLLRAGDIVRFRAVSAAELSR